MHVFLFFLLDVQRLIFDRFQLNVSVTTVKRARKRLGWAKSGVTYCQLVKEKNRIERLAFVTKCQTNNDKFDNVIFTDESSIWLEQHALPYLVIAIFVVLYIHAHLLRGLSCYWFLIFIYFYIPNALTLVYIFLFIYVTGHYAINYLKCYGTN